MKYLLLLLLLIDPTKIGKINSLKAEARKAYENGEYAKAASLYRTLTDSLGVQEDELAMNLAHTKYHLKDTTGAKQDYQSITRASSPTLRSIAYQQLGLIEASTQKYEPALELFRQAMLANPANKAARFNYEVIKKKLEEQKKQQKQDQDNKDKKDQKDQEKKDQEKKDQQKKDQQDQDKKDKKDQDENKDQNEQNKKDQEKKEKEQKEKQQKEQEQNKDKEKKETPPDVSEKMKQMKISEEKARMILEALKNQEVQYLQQNKRKATKPKSKGKPDW